MSSVIQDEIKFVSGAEIQKCMRCGKCSGACPAYDEMEYHPHEFVYMVEKGEIDKLMASASAFKCLSCFACVERCPRGVAPAKVVEAIRLQMVRRQNENHMKAEDVPCIADDDAMPGQLIVSAFRKFKK